MQSYSQSDAIQRRVSLSKHRNEIEQWVSQGRADEWIANALGTSQSSVQSFRSRNGIMRQRNRKSTTVPDDKHDENRTHPEHVYEGVLDQGEDGYGLWLDPAVVDDPLFREGFSSVSDVRVLIEPDRIVLEPVSGGGNSQGNAPAAPAAETPAGNALADLLQAANNAGSGRSGSGSVNGGSPGKVKFFDAEKGFGFITLPEGGEIFFHRSAIEGGKELEAGEFVFYEAGSTQRGPAAKSVRAAG